MTLSATSSGVVTIAESAALKLQRLRSQEDQTLVLGLVAGERAGNGWFRTAGVTSLFAAFRIPTPNSSAVLANLRSNDLTVSRRAGGNNEWSLTPEGRERARSVLADLDYAALMAEEETAPGAEFMHALHTVLDPVFAPARWTAGIARLHGRYPFERNVFCMTRFPSEEEGLPDPVGSVVEELRSVADDHGLLLHIASDRQLDDDLLANVGAYMWGSAYGIGLVEDRLGTGLNYNVVTELGAMLMTGRRCALLKDRTAPGLPTDLAGQLYKPTDFDDLDAVDQEIHAWMADDLGLGRCERCS